MLTFAHGTIKLGKYPLYAGVNSIVSLVGSKYLTCLIKLKHTPCVLMAVDEVALLDYRHPPRLPILTRCQLVEIHATGNGLSSVILSVPVHSLFSIQNFDPPFFASILS